MSTKRGDGLPAELAELATVASFPPIQSAIPEPEDGKRQRYRTIWISDIHLGTKGCNAAMLIDFLDSTDSETMYLVGDIIDGWRLKKKFYWPAEHNDVVWRILKRAKRGTRIVYIPGNRYVNGGRRMLGLPYWSLSKMAKHKVKNAVEFISKYEEVVARAAGERGVDGVVCGHIHTAEIREFDGIEYYNDGDWVEGCNALVEHFDGRMELLHWPEALARRDAHLAPEPAGEKAAA